MKNTIMKIKKEKWIVISISSLCVILVIFCISSLLIFSRFNMVFRVSPFSMVTVLTVFSETSSSASFVVVLGVNKENDILYTYMLAPSKNKAIRNSETKIENLLME